MEESTTVTEIGDTIVKDAVLENPPETKKTRKSKTTITTEGVPTINKRDKNGLLEGVTHIFKDNGRKVDWFAMIPKEYIVPNQANFKKRNEPVPTSIDGLENKDLLILLAGFRYITEIRGFEEIDLPVVKTTENRTTTVVRIKWLPNFETEYRAIITSAEGDATLESTKNFGFIGPISENRAFCRNVRAFLKIPVLGKDELDNNNKNTEDNSSAAPDNNQNNISTLISLMEIKGINFKTIKEKLIKEGVTEVENCQTVNDFPKPIIFTMIERLQKLKNKEDKK